MQSFKRAVLVAGGIALAMPSTSYAEASFDLAKLNATTLKTPKVSEPDRDPIIVSAVRYERPRHEQSHRDQIKAAAIQSEAVYFALSAADAAQTISCLSRNECVETNPILGRHPSAAKVILLKAGMGALHFMAFKKALSQDPRSALRLAQISCSVQGAVVSMNARMSFR